MEAQVRCPFPDSDFHAWTSRRLSWPITPLESCGLSGATVAANMHLFSGGGRSPRVETGTESEVCFEAIGQESGIHGSRGVDSGARNRSQYSDLQRGARGSD